MRLIDADALRADCDIYNSWDAQIVKAWLDDQPTIKERKTGRWIVVSDGYGNGEATACICECSECKDTIWVYKKADRKWNFCPNCGAKMEVEHDS